MIRYGQMTEDELFVTAAAAQRGRPHREPQRIGSARDPEALRSGQSGRARAGDKTERGMRNAGCEPSGSRIPDPASRRTGKDMHNKPALHNAMWPGLVGKGGPGAEPPIDLDTMLDLTAAARSNGSRFDGVDLFLFDPHVSIDSTDDDLKRLADKIRAKGLVVGSLVAPVWPPTGGGSAMGERRGAQRVPDAGAQGLRDRQEAARPRHPPLRHRPHRLGGEPVGVGEGSGRQHEEDRRDVPPGGRRSPRSTASGSRPKARSAGAACTA